MIYRTFYGVEMKQHQYIAGTNLYSTFFFTFAKNLLYFMPVSQSNNPLHGITLEMMLNHLVAHYGWETMSEYVNIRCFQYDPSVKSSLAFLRKTPWHAPK